MDITRNIRSWNEMTIPILLFFDSIGIESKLLKSPRFIIFFFNFILKI
jgi:hypothetical protein